MKYCSNCGKEVKGETNFCPNCGSSLQGNSNPKQFKGNIPHIERKDIAIAIILSIVTCGIYGIVWLVNIINDINTVASDDKSDQSAGLVILLIIVTCGIYGFVYFYQAGARLHNAGKKYGLEIADNSVVYLLLTLFGLGIVTYCLIQSDLNKFADK